MSVYEMKHLKARPGAPPKSIKTAITLKIKIYGAYVDQGALYSVRMEIVISIKH